jgi:hypothetical protein
MIRLFGVSVWIHFVFILVLGFLLTFHLLHEGFEGFQVPASGSGSVEPSPPLLFDISELDKPCGSPTSSYGFSEQDCPKINGIIDSIRNTINKYKQLGRIPEAIGFKNSICNLQYYYNTLKCATYKAPTQPGPQPTSVYNIKAPNNSLKGIMTNNSKYS